MPSSDDRNGPKNALLKMDNLELDKNGSLSLTGGTTVVGSAYTNNAHSLFSAPGSSARIDYLADVVGGVFRNGSSIGSGGSTTRAAFSTAFKYTLFASGSLRKKDLGSGTPVNLGLTTPSVVPTAVVDGYLNALCLNDGSMVATLKSGTYGSGGPWDFIDVLADGAKTSWVIEGQMTGAQDSTIFTATNSTSTAISYIASDSDYFIVQFLSTLGVDVLKGVTSITFDLFLDTHDNYYTYTYNVDSQVNGRYSFNLFVQRNQFSRIGNSQYDWKFVTGYRLSIAGSSQFYVPLLSVNTYCWAGALPGAFSPATLLRTGAGITNTNVSSIDGIRSFGPGYQFAQVNVNNTGSYLAKSQISPTVGPIYPSLATVRLLPNITGIEAQVNEIWLYVRGGNLAQWYRVALFTAANWTVPQYWATPDTDIQTLGITFDLTLTTINSTGIPAAILEIIGPIEGRWMYFTSEFMYPSDINDPDLVNTGLGVRLCGTGNETFLWAKQVDKDTVLVGTSLDVYVLTGTFVTLADGTIDLFYRKLSVKFPPIAIDATVGNGSVFYMANDGWRSIDASGFNPLLVAPITDRIYQGVTCYGYSVNTKVVAGTVRFPVILGLNKMWCSITGQSRCEVLDTSRKYWRNFSIQQGDILAICSTPDGNVLAFYSGDKKLRLLGTAQRLIDAASNQTISILSPVFDNSTSDCRKDTATLKLRGDTGGVSIAVSIVDETNTTTVIGNFSAAGILEKVLDVSQLIPLLKTFQFILTGAPPSFTLEEVIFYFETRPAPVSFARVYNQNFGNASKKRVRNWPTIIDSGGRDITFQAINDNSNGATTTLNTPEKTTKSIFYKTDVFAVDYGGTLYCSTGTFEFWGMMQPDIVQTLPIARQFDQVGPEELFRYGRIRELEFRLLSYGTTIPWTMYFNDNSVKTGSFTTISGLEQSFFEGIPQGAGGQIVRIEIGPTNFDFHRYYIRVKVMKIGGSADAEWITLGQPQ